jgi:hypothetical protein
VFDCFFAEAQHNLNGLHENILDALAKSDAFITVIHRRGNVSYGPDKHEPLDRASVWIEQEIAIAAFIQRTSKNELLTAAYIERGVGREGLRDLLHLNPLEFTSNDEIIADLKSKLATWHKSSSSDNLGEVDLDIFPGYQSQIRVKHLTPVLINRGNRANEYSCTLEVPKALLSHQNGWIVGEQPGGRPGFRTFLMTEEAKGKSPLIRGSRIEMMKITVAIDHLTQEQREQALKQDVEVIAQIGDRAYSLTKSCAEIFAETQLAQREQIAGPDAEFGYFHFESKPDKPLCPKCYQSSPSKPVYMGPRDQRAGGIMRFCPVCNFTVTEDVRQQEQHRQSFRGPDSWME